MNSKTGCGVVSGEALFGAFIQPCIEGRHEESVRCVKAGRAETFSEECLLRYVSFTETGESPTRQMLKEDFPIPCADLVRFAASMGIENEDCVWSHDVVALFWRAEHHKDDPGCRVLAGRVLNVFHEHHVVLVTLGDEEVVPVVNLLRLTLRAGDIVSVHKMVICEKREEE